jgi:outer membrane protein assembly factor BamB
MRNKAFIFLSLLLFYILFFRPGYCFASTDNQNSLYLFNDEVFLNNTPRDINYPFYPADHDFKVYEFNPQADHVYINNLKLKFRPNDLLQKDAYLWVNRKIPALAPKAGIISTGQTSLPLDKINSAARRLWSFDLPSDNLKDFYFDMRQWVKKYEENPLYCAVYNTMVLLRNEYRVFCLDLLTGQKLWSLSVENGTGEEFLKTSRPPHQDAYGNEFLLEQGIVFTELNGKFVAIKTTDILKPEILWETSLGEYTLCAKPVKIDKTVILGLINARGEIWFSGFNADNGKSEWNTYVGVSGILSPVCTLSTQMDKRVFVGTNHGVIACLSADKGRILWLRKYAPKKYSILDFWEKGYFRDKISDQRSISFDTQFIALANDKVIYYKPRESEYLYAIDPITGELKNQMRFDPEKSYLLAVLNGQRVVLEKDPSVLKVYDANSGVELRRFNLKAGPLKGVIYPGDKEIIFKIEDTLYLLESDEGAIALKQITPASQGWLVNNHGRFIFSADNNTLTCDDIFGKNIAFNEKDPIVQELVKQRKVTAEGLSVLLKRSPRGSGGKAKINKMVSDLVSCRLPIQAIFPAIQQYVLNLRDPAWKEFLVFLKDNYGSEVVEYKGVKTRLVNFLYGFGLADSPFKSGLLSRGNSAGAENLKKYDISSANVMLVPLNIIKGPKLLDFYLLLDKDQLICAKESGQILWIRRICCGNHFSNMPTSYYEHFEGIRAYLYNGEIIINDFTNIVAVDAASGAYLWGITDLESRRLHAGFLQDKFAVVNADKMFTVDPVTGIRREDHQFKASEIQLREVYFDKDNIYGLAADLSRIQVFNSRLKLTQAFILRFVENEISDQVEWFFTEKYIILHNGFNVYLINKKTGVLEKKLFIKDDAGFPVKVANPNEPTGWVISAPTDYYWYSLEACDNMLLVIAPFQRITAYSLDAPQDKPKWVQQIRIDGGLNIYKLVSANYRDLKTYFLADGYLLFPFIAYDKIFLASLDIQSGVLSWKTVLKPAVELFCMLRAVKESTGTLELMVSTVDLGETLEARTVLADIDSEMFKINSKNGVILQKEKLPSVSEIGFRKSSFIQTQNWVLYNMHMNKIKAVRKDAN